MTARPDSFRVTIARLVGLAAVAALATAVTVPPPAAQAAAGTTTLKLDGPAAEALRERGVKIVPLAPAKGGAKRVALPIAAGLAGTRTTLLRQRGGIELRAGEEKLRLRGLSLVLGKRARMEARVGGEDVDLFRVQPGGRRKIDSVTGSVDLGGLRLKLTGAGAEAIAARLGIEKPRPQRFATLAASIKGLTASGSPPSLPGPSQRASCPLPSTAGPAPEEPLPEKVRPVAAVDVTGATIDWHVRESFIRYINTGEGTSVSGGASADPPVVLQGSSAALSYAFHFPFAAGWLDPGGDPGSAADDTALLDYSGAVRFLYSGHEIDLATANPEIEIAGAASRAVFEVAEKGGAPSRQVLVNLDLSRAAGISVNGNSYVYERVPGAIPAGTATSVFAGFYAPGTEFGCVTVRFSTG